MALPDSEKCYYCKKVVRFEEAVALRVIDGEIVLDTKEGELATAHINCFTLAASNENLLKYKEINIGRWYEPL